MIRQVDNKAPSFSTGLEGLEGENVSNIEKSGQEVAVADLSSVATQVLRASGELRKMEQNIASQFQASQLHSKIGASPDDPKSYEVGPNYNDVRQGKGELAKGHAGAGVMTLQQKLTRAGFPTKADAYFGSKTETALKEFQRKNNLPDTGKLDKQTLDALDKAAGPDPKPSPQPKPSPKPSPAPKPEPGPSPGPTPIIPNDLKLPDDPKLKTAALLDMASTKMENGYKKGQDPKFDAAVQTFLNADDLNPAKLGTDNPADAKLEASTSRFREAAHKAGF